MSEEPRGLRIARTMAETAYRLYSDLVGNAAQRIVRWEWADFTRYSLEPCYFELHKFRPGEPLEREPDPPMSGATGHAFDSDGNLIAERDQTEVPGMCSETYYVYERDGVACYYFGYESEKPWRHVAWMSRDDNGRIIRIDRVHMRGNFFSETFEYDEPGRVVRYSRQGPNPPYGEMNDVIEIEYDEQGNVSKTVWVYPDGTRHTDFERPRPDRMLSSCREELSEGLTKAILSALTDAAPDAPVYALALYYCDAEYQHRVPPNVAFATERDLARFRTQHPDDFQYYVWYPAEWERHLSLDLGDQLADICHSVSEDIWQNELDDEVNTLLRDIASMLSGSTLPIPRSAAFVAYVTNLDNGDAVSDVRRSVTAEAQGLLSQMGLL